MKVSVCCIGKLENHYIREFVEHYKKLGFYKIYLYDNNDIDGERFEDVIGDYIKDGFVTLVDFRGRKGILKYGDRTSVQLDAYNHCYIKYKNEFDWILFVDIDEFIEFEYDDNINDFVCNKMFNGYNNIKLSWKYYNDNDLVEVKDNNYSVTRFTKPVTTITAENMYVKSLIKSGLNIVIDSPHGFMKIGCGFNFDKHVIKSCNAIGEEDILEQILKDKRVVHRNAWINHYRYKTISEFLETKSKRGWPDSHSINYGKLEYDEFFKWNKNTEEKMLVVKKFLGQF